MDDTACAVLVELPGLAKDGIALAVERDGSTLGAVVRRDAVLREGECCIRSVRFIDSRRRGFAPGADVDPERVVARWRTA